uniref:Uncharacterized protein n=2 Tax=Haptolina brevifila TaxID=156173 RepID=A0A7S2D1H6_9EUKA|mmetsp:Transcript_3151/g.6776  ORF Transcript_3151/g.6776 Transcript_3151/m.6776 type:complete len:191 (+) Transcript_3151:180-752(+)
MRFFGGDGGEAARAAEEVAQEAAKEDARQVIVRSRDERRAAVTRVNAALSSATHRMAALEQDFLNCKHANAFHLGQEMEMAMRCSKMEGVLIDNEDALDHARAEGANLAAEITVLEEEVGAENIMRGREVRAVETLNGGRIDPDAATPRKSPATSFGTKPRSNSGDSFNSFRRKSFNTNLEEILLKKIAL